MPARSSEFEKVIRWKSSDVEGIYSDTERREYAELGEWVESSEFDRLLAAYKELEQENESLRCPAKEESRGRDTMIFER